VDAGEDDCDGPAAVILERMHLPVEAGQLERRGGISERKSRHAGHAIHVGRLYDAVGLGMWAYSNAAFRVVVIGPRRLRLEPGTLIVVAHRRETDVPVVGPPLYFRARLWRHHEERMAFAARDDMFVPGFFAGFPPELPPLGRRLLYRVGVGRFLLGIGVYPISSASVARVAELLRQSPHARLADVLPPGLADGLRARSDQLGLSAPDRAADALRGEYADLLWRPLTRAEAAGPEGFWDRRATQAAADFRRLVEVLRQRSLVVFPEGRPSPDGEIGPLRRGLAALARRAQPRWLLPIAIAYDPLVLGRTRAVVTFGPRMEAPREDLEAMTLELLRKGTALTSGQYVAHELGAGRNPTDAGLSEAVEEACAERRPVDPELLDPERRASRLMDAVAAVGSHQAELPFLAREYASARGR
jgi:Acyltransferase